MEALSFTPLITEQLGLLTVIATIRDIYMHLYNDTNQLGVGIIKQHVRLVRP